jgi:hypothetical protein
VKLSANWRPVQQFARTRQNFPETRPLRANAVVPDRFTIHVRKGVAMTQRFTLFRPGGVFYAEDTTTGKQLWHLGGSQPNVAGLRSEDIDWQRQTISYGRLQTHTTATPHFSDTIAKVLKTLPPTGPLFPRLAQMEEKHRAAEFRRKCKRLQIEGGALSACG